MFNEKNYARVFLGGLITGGILGGIAGLLFAPKSGKKLRRDISKKTDEIIDDAKQQIENAAEVASNIISDAKKKAESLINDGKKKIEAVAKASENMYKNGKDIVEEKVSKIKNIF
jgi:gas vesicle protein